MRILFFVISTIFLATNCKESQTKQDQKTSPSSAPGTAANLSGVAHVKITTDAVDDGGAQNVIETNAALVDINPKYLGLIVPGKPLLYPSPKPELSYVPFVKSISLQIYFQNLSTPDVELKSISIDNAGMVVGGVKFFAVGFWLEQQDTTSAIAKILSTELGGAFMDKLEAQYLSKSSLAVNGVDLRNNYTAFVMIAVPKNDKWKDLQFPKPLAAETRPLESDIGSGKLFTITFDKATGTRKQTDVKALNTSGDKTPLYSLIKDDETKRRQIWEIGTGKACMDAEMGAPLLYQKSSSDTPTLVGWLSKSAVTTDGYHSDDCKANGSGDYATLVVSPAQSHYDSLNKLLN